MLLNKQPGPLDKKLTHTNRFKLPVQLFTLNRTEIIGRGIQQDTSRLFLGKRFPFSKSVGK
jgi:hypothetical protein